MATEREWVIEGFHVLEDLGRGRRGQVALAEAEADGRRVVVERASGASRRELARFRQELALLERLEHPGLARLVDWSGSGRTLWWAWEAPAGASLRRILSGATEASQDPARWWTDGWGVVEGVPFAPLAIARRLGEALAYLHGEGRIHGSLRPESVLIRPDGTPVLVDLGPSGDHGLRGHATPPGLRVADLNAVAYVPPEKIQGEAYDARGDLYSLGCLLYEMLTGQPPYVGDVSRVVEQHLRDRPEPPSRLAEGLPQPLERLVLQLLRKQPEARPGYAAVVARALSAVEGASETDEEPPPGRPYLYRPQMLGRGLILSKLKAAVSATADRRGSFLLMDGGHGSGRSRLLSELQQWAGRALCEVFSGACRPPDSVRSSQALGPLRGMADSLYERCRAGGPEVTRRLLGVEAKLLSIFEPAFAELPGLDNLPDPAELAPLPVQKRVFVAILQILERLSASRPVLVIIEDLEWADPWTLDLLTFLARVREERPRRWTLVATYRDDLGETPELRELREHPAVTHLHMDPLDATTLAEVVGSMLAWPSPPADFTRWLFERSEGRPLYAAEFLRAAVSEGRLTLAPHGGWEVDGGYPLSAEAAETLGLPKTLDGLIRRRLDQLEGPARELLELAALFGLYFRAEWLEDAADDRAWTTLDELARQRLLVLSPSGEMRFAHNAIRQEVLNTLDPDQASDRHRAVASALALAEGSEPDLAANAARHWELAGAREEALAAYTRAARDVDSRGDFLEARRLLLAYFRLLQDPTPESVRARIRLADIEAASGRPHEALEQSREAHREALELGAEHEAAEALLVLGRSLDTMGVAEETLEVLDRAGEMYEGLGDLVGNARRLTLTSQVHRRLERREQALRAAVEALSLFREAGDRKHEGSALLLAGGILQRMGHAERAKGLFDEALRLSRESDTPHSEAAALASLGLMAQEDGDDLHAAGLIGRALERYAEVGDLPNQGAMHRNLGLIAFAANRYDDALAHLEHARAVARDVESERDEGLALSLLSVAYLEKGALLEALTACERGLEIHRRQHNRGAQGHSISYLAQIRYAQRDFESAARLFEQAMAIDRELGARAMRGVNLVGLALCVYQQAGAGAEERQRADELFEQGLAAHQGNASPRHEAYTRVRWAAFHRRQGWLSQARRHLDEAAELLVDNDVPYCRALLLCERGHLALAEGGRSDDFLAEASALADRLHLLPTSEVGRALDRLARAEIARGASQPLVHGESL